MASEFPVTPSEAEEISLRQATRQDLGLLFAWRNHPDVYRYFFNPQPVSWDEHSAWFAKALGNEGCIILIALDADEHPVGVLRFETRGDGDTAEVNILVAPGLEGRGYGKSMLRNGTLWLKENTAVRRVEAKVLEANRRSLRLFEGAGFKMQYHAMELDMRGPDCR